MITSSHIRSLYTDYFVKNNHTNIKSSALVPNNDPTLMFTNSGMVQFKDVFTGKESRPYQNATSVQKCVRAGGKHNDLDNVGFTKRHMTFFEMLGNFSFGGYSKEEAIKLAWMFITNELKLDKSRIYITTYSQDEEAFNIWKKVSGFADDKIIKISTKDNFWSMGDTGPCGPCSEIFYDQGEEMYGGLPGTKDQDGDRFVEIWNLVFMQFEQNASGEMKNLPRKCVDTGMGLERIAGVVQGVYDNFKIDLMRNLISSIEDIVGVSSKDGSPAHRVIADHLRSSSFLIADGVMPSNEGRGYVLRRIIRRAIRYISNLGYKDLLLHQLVPSLGIEMGESYPELVQNQHLIMDSLKMEESAFRNTLDKGLHLLNSEITMLSSGSTLAGDVAFKLHDTYGFPIDLTQSILRERDISVDTNGFEAHMKEQKDRARKAWAGSGADKVNDVWFQVKEQVGEIEFIGYTQSATQGVVKALVQNGVKVDSVSNEQEFYLITNQTPFYGESGGQMGDIGFIKLENNTQIQVLDTIKPLQGLYAHKCVITKEGAIKIDDIAHMQINESYRQGLRRNHTATHLLHAALREKLGSQVIQKGSLVANNRLRFDFAYSKAISRETLDEIETTINTLILENIEISTKLMKLDEAIEDGAMALFGEKYDDYVRVVSIEVPDKKHSIELCGGTHVSSLGEIGMFKIINETSIASGIRRIDAVTGNQSLELFQKNTLFSKDVSGLLQAKEDDVLEKISQLINSNKNLQKELDKINKDCLNDSFKKVNPTTINNMSFIHFMSNGSVESIRSLIQQRVSQHDNEIIVIGSPINGGLFMVCGLSKNLHNSIKANELIQLIINKFNGKGGGSPLLAQASIDNKDISFEQLVQLIKSHLEAK